MTPEQLKYSILKFAFSGKLVASDTDAELPNIKVIDFDVVLQIRCTSSMQIRCA